MRHLRSTMAMLVALITMFTIAPVATAADTTFEAESMSVSPKRAGSAFLDATASQGTALRLSANSTASKRLSLPASTKLAVRARGIQCQGAPAMTVAIDGKAVMATSVTATSWTLYTVSTIIAAGTQIPSPSASPTPSAEFPATRSLLLDSTTAMAGGQNTQGAVPLGMCAARIWLSNTDIGRELDIAQASGTTYVRVDVDWAYVEATGGSTTGRIPTASSMRFWRAA